MSTVGKRTGTDQPLTEHDVAERLTRAVERVLRILGDSRQLGLMEDVKSSRYLPVGTLEFLAGELVLGWGIQPRAWWNEVPPTLKPDE